MPDGFDFVNSVTPHFLEGIVKEEKLKRDRPRQLQNPSRKQARKVKNADAPPDDDHNVGTSVSTQHIDLRV